MNLIHYYHLFAGGRWYEPWREHITALIESGLYEKLDSIKIGIVGNVVTSQDAVQTVKQYDKVEIITTGKDSRWEQKTLGVLQTDLTVMEESYVLYAHTKGAANNRHDQDNWRREMTAGVVYHWRECVDLLAEGVGDAVGCRWRRNPWRHYSGTMWWATSSYLSTLAPISYVYRDDAEAWIGQSFVGGTHVEIDPSQPNLGVAVHSFGRTFVSGRTITGYSNHNPYDFTNPLLGDELIGFSPTEGTKIISYLITNGATCSLIGNTIIVESVK